MTSSANKIGSNTVLIWLQQFFGLSVLHLDQAQGTLLVPDIHQHMLLSPVSKLLYSF